MLGSSFRRRTRRAVDSDAARRRLSVLGVELVQSGADGASEEAEPPGVAPPGAAPPDPAPPDPAPRGPAPPPDPEPVGLARPPTPVGPGRHVARPLAAGTRLRAALSDRLSPSVRSAMDGTFSGHHLGVLAIVLATGLAITAWWVLSGRPEQQSVPTVSFSSPTPGVPAPAETPASLPTTAGSEVSSEVVIVDVAGKVRRPGIVTLPVGSRVIDALKAAGGARPGVDLVTLNLARLLVDGEQLLVGVAPAVVPSSTSGMTVGPSVPGGLVNLNTADQATLETLPGVGPVTAQAILDWRTENGAFTSVDELLEVDGIGEVTLAELRDLVTV